MKWKSIKVGIEEEVIALQDPNKMEKAFSME